MRTATFLLILAPVVFEGTAATARPDRAAALRAEFEARKRKVLVEAAQEHLKLGSWSRDAGLVAQATAEFLRAVEVADGRHPGALRVLAFMRNLEGKFWTRKLKDPSPGLIRSYDKRARKARRTIEKARFKLAAWARGRKELQEEAYEAYRDLVADGGRPLELDSKGCVRLEHGVVPAEVSTRLTDEAVSINERLYVRDAFLALMPDVEALSERETEDLRVRTPRGRAEAERLLAAAQALLPYLEEDTGGRPSRQLDLFVFPTRQAYGAFLDAAELGEHKVGTGLADGGRNVAIVCAEGLDDDAVLGVALHELSHLFQYAVTPVVMPSWYAEGFAETWGGPGTYAWDGETLTAGGPYRADRLEVLQTDEGYLPLEDLLRGDALAILTEARDRAPRFYAESWAFLRYMRTEAPQETQEQFRRWELLCKGAALGAEAGKPYGRNTKPAGALFRTMFADDLEAIEVGFRAWLRSL